MKPTTRPTLFALFFLSGFASLVYQVVWTRMAFASFGVIAPVMSVVLSVFMVGLAVGSWAGGRWIGPLSRRTGLPAVAFYAAAELLIGVGAFAVPPSFKLAERLLLSSGEVDSTRYLFGSAVALAAAILPWCACMGVTFPFMMAHVREQDAADATSFSFLYLANVLGAMFGTMLTALVLVELLGFHHTLWVAALCNLVIAVTAVTLAVGRRSASGSAGSAPDAPLVSAFPVAGRSDARLLAVLFLTGFVSMALEVVWCRGFAAVLKTQVYSFAMIVFAYLGATFAGSWLYRRHLRRGRLLPRQSVLLAMAASVFLPVIVDDPKVVVQVYDRPVIDVLSAVLLLASICPLCAALGYLTPSLVDDYARGDPQRAGRAYAGNVLGCILGPLVACYGVLPAVSGRYAIILLGLPLVAVWLEGCRPAWWSRRTLVGGLTMLFVLGYSVLFARDDEELIAAHSPTAVIRRDSLASVLAFARRDGRKCLVVNGIGMTSLTPITKFITHLPLLLHAGPPHGGPPRSMLVICFGMGTSFRSALSWGIDTTVVELDPSVPKDFGFYHRDAARCVADPHGRIVIDDGRRYLARCGRSFDVITVDPPPPIQAAGSSLLFSTDFYALARRHLNPGGVVQMWYPGGDDLTLLAVGRAMRRSFPFTESYSSVEGWGAHLVGSTAPLAPITGEQAAALMPAPARADLLEWADTGSASEYLQRVLAHRFDLSARLDPAGMAVTDDTPVNEYYLLREMASTAVPGLTPQQ